MASNKYDLYGDVQEQYQLKVNYDDAKKKGDTKGMEDAAKAATVVRQRMVDNGYGDLAKQFEGYNTAQMGNYLKYYPTQGKSSFRDYLKGSKLVTEYGYTPEQIDNMIGFNNATKEITFGGQNIGKADTIVDGVSYFSNDFMDGVIDGHIQHVGLTPKVTSDVNTQKLLGIQSDDHKNMTQKYDELYDFGMNANPFETETGKAIMADYNLKAMQGRDNAAASGAASNGGNIDSFAAANALKQQASLTAMGQQQAIAAQSQRINDVRGILGDMGTYQQGSYQGMQTSIGMQSDIEQRAFENEQTEKLTDHQINLDMATVLGYEPKAWAAANNQYFGDDGMLLNPSTDFGTIIKNAEEKLKTATDPEEIKRLNATINDATFARQFKVNNYPEYGKYASEVSGYNPRRTLEGEAQDFSINESEKNNAIAGLASMIQMGITPSADDIKKAGLDMTPEEVLKAYNNNTLSTFAMQAAYSGKGGGNTVNSGTDILAKLKEGWTPDFSTIKLLQDIEPTKTQWADYFEEHLYPLYMMPEMSSEERQEYVKNVLITAPSTQNIDPDNSIEIMKRIFGEDVDVSWVNDYVEVKQPLDRLDIPTYNGKGEAVDWMGMITKDDFKTLTGYDSYDEWANAYGYNSYDEWRENGFPGLN